MEEPQTWPALLQLPENQYTGTATHINAAGNGLVMSSAPLLYTGDNRGIADNLMAALFSRQQSLGGLLYMFWHFDTISQQMCSSDMCTHSECTLFLPVKQSCTAQSWFLMLCFGLAWLCRLRLQAYFGNMFSHAYADCSSQPLLQFRLLALVLGVSLVTSQLF